MYTPKGEVQQELLELLEQEKVMRELEDCRDRETLLAALKERGVKISPEEAEETLTVIMAYLEEELRERLLSEEDLDQVAGGMQAQNLIFQKRITGLLEGGERSVKGIFQIFQNLQNF